MEDLDLMVRRVLSLGALALILVLVSITSLDVYVIEGQQGVSPQGDLMDLYSLYRTSYTNLSIIASLSASAPGSSVIGVAGVSRDGGYAFEAIHIDRSSGRVERHVYMLTGAPTAIASDGDFGRYIAVGDERGEVLVYSVSDRSVSYIQASRYPVKRVAIGVGGSGDPYLAVLDAGGYLYMYRVSRGGWAEIGPERSTAIYNYSEGYVLDISPAESVAGGSMRVDPSLILAIYRPPSIVAIFNVSNETGFPIDGAVVSANLSQPAVGRPLLLQAITANGSASLELPILDPYNTTYLVRITHPSYLSEDLSIGFRYVGWNITSYIRYMGVLTTITVDARYSRQILVPPITMREGAGELVPVAPRLNVTLASIVDLRGAPEEIRVGRPVPLFLDPVEVKLVRPNIVNTPWSYLGVVVGCCIQGSPAVAFIYYREDLGVISFGGDDYKWYVLPRAPLDRAWIGYDDNGLGVSVMLPSGRVYYFLYDGVRGYHIAFWGSDIPGRILAASYRNGALASLDDRGDLHIYRLSPTGSMPCTRGGDYLGVPVGVGVGAYISSDGVGYIATSDRAYIAWGLASIARDRCPLDMVRLRASIEIADVISSYGLSIPGGRVEVYENGELVAAAPISNGSSTLYLPQGEYEVLVRGGIAEYRSRISVPHSYVEVVGPTLYRVNISTYFYNPESPYTASIQRAPPGLVLVIDNKTSLVLGDSPQELLLGRGVHTAMLLWRDVVLARGVFNVSAPGPLDLVLVAEVATLTANLSILGQAGQTLSPGQVVLRLFGEGPLLTGDLGSIRPGEAVKLPLGIYRVVAESPFFYSSEARVGLREPGGSASIMISLRAREIPVRLIILDDFGSPVQSAEVSIYRAIPGTLVFRGATSDDGSLVVPSISFGEYIVSIEPANRSMYTPFTGPLRVDRQEIILRVNRTLQPVSIALSDPISGRPIAPLGVSIYIGDRIVYSGEVNSSSYIVNTSIPFGDARIVVEPTQQASQIYSRVEISRRIDVGGGRIEITLARRIMDYSVRVINDLGQPVQGAIITIRSVENPSIELTGITDSNGLAPFRIPYSSYIVEVTAQGYNRLETTLPLDRSSVSLQLQPTIFNLIQRYTFIYIAVGIIVAIAIASRYIRRYIERKIEEEA